MDRDDVAATWAVTAWSQPPAESVAPGTTLLAEVAGSALGTLVNDVVAAGPGEARIIHFRRELLMPMATAEGDHAAAM